MCFKVWIRFIYKLRGAISILQGWKIKQNGTIRISDTKRERPKYKNYFKET